MKIRENFKNLVTDIYFKLIIPTIGPLKHNFSLIT